MDRYQYLLVMAGCVVVTLPLEVLCGARVWRRPRRLVRALMAPVVAFGAWDVVAIAHHQWRYARRYVTGVDLPGHLPVEEVVFFVVVPVCALLTFEVVTRMLGPDRHPGRPGWPVARRRRRASRVEVEVEVEVEAGAAGRRHPAPPVEAGPGGRDGAGSPGRDPQPDRAPEAS